jgi:hypothetical protein
VLGIELRVLSFLGKCPSCYKVSRHQPRPKPGRLDRNIPGRDHSGSQEQSRSGAGQKGGMAGVGREGRGLLASVEDCNCKK